MSNFSARNVRDYEPPSRIRNPELLEAGRARIIAVALDLFARQGFHETGVEEIAAGAGLTVGALYKYVRAKHDILYLTSRFITESIAEDFSSYLEGSGDPEARLRGAIDSYFRTIDRYHSAVRLNYRYNTNLDPEARHHLFTMFDTLRNGFVNSLRPVATKLGEGDEGVLRVIAENLVILGQMWAINHRAYAEHLTLEEFVKVQTELTLRQISNGPKSAARRSRTPHVPGSAAGATPC